MCARWNTRELNHVTEIKVRDKRINRLVAENKRLRNRLEDLREFVNIYSSDPNMAQLIEMVKKPSVRKYLNSML